MVNEDDFQRAVKYKDYRHDFVSSLDLNPISKYVKNVEYTPKKRDDVIMATRMHLFPRVLGNKKSDIKIYPEAFSSFYCIDDFLGCLYFHEGQHAKDFFYDGFSCFSGLLIQQLYDFISKGPFVNITHYLGPADEKRCELEIRACQNQLKNFDKMNFSQLYKIRVQNNLEFYMSHRITIKSYRK